VQPNDLAFAKHIELSVITRTAINLMNLSDVWLPILQGVRQATVEVGRQDRSHQPPHHEIGQNFVTATYPVARLR
jgi:hypothetical protein